MTEKCFICRNDIVSDACHLSEKGIEGLIKASIARKDGNDEFFKNKKSIVLHVSCRKQYTRPQTIARDLKMDLSQQQSTASCSTPSLRSAQTSFEFKRKCLLCAEIIDDAFYAKESKKPLHRRRHVYPVRTTKFDQSLVIRAKERNDEWGDAISRRISIVGDLHAADAIYHDDCYKKFFIATVSSGKKREDEMS